MRSTSKIDRFSILLPRVGDRAGAARSDAQRPVHDRLRADIEQGRFRDAGVVFTELEADDDV